MDGWIDSLDSYSVIFQLPSLYINGQQSQKIDDAVAAYRKEQHEKKATERRSIQSLLVMSSSTNAEDAESAGLGEDEFEEWEDFKHAIQPIAPIPLQPVDPSVYVREESKNMEFVAELANKQIDPAYKEMIRFRKRLPAHQAKGVRKWFFFVKFPK